MIINLHSDSDADRVERELRAAGLWVERLSGPAGPQFRVKNPSPVVSAERICNIPGVASVAVADSKHPLLDRHPATLEIAGIILGDPSRPVVMAGPCGVESEQQILRLAARLAPLGVTFLRGGAYKPRSSPYAFQGAGKDALVWLRKAADENGLAVVTECLASATAERVAEAADLVQIGSRNMHNYDLLKVVAQTGRPVLLKRGMAATIEEWKLAAEYCLSHGAAGVVLCERGIRSFDPSTRGVLDLGAVALLSNVDRLPIIADPSHGAGRRDLIPPLSRAALAAGACGLLVECHDAPGDAKSDGPQALLPAELEELLGSLRQRLAERDPATVRA